MNTYRADIGTWEQFRVDTYEAPNDKAAIQWAFNRLRKYQADFEMGQESDVVQIYCGNVLVWDYYGNGRASNNDDNALILPP